MLVTENSVDGALTVHADVPDGVTLPPAGVFNKITVLNWYAVRSTDQHVMVGASIPNMVELEMSDESKLLVWPDGTFVVYAPDGETSWSLKITPDGVVPNPYRD